MTKDEKLYKNNFRHFGSRLSLRYGILITFEYYVILCKLSWLKNAETKPRTDGRGLCRIGILEIDGCEVVVVKSLHLPGKPLLTVLHPAK